MSALEKAKAMGMDELFAKADGLLEFGMDRTPVVEKWKETKDARGFWPYPVRAVAALNNGDLNRALLVLLRDNPEKVLEGLSAAALAVEAEEKLLYVPEGEEKLAEALTEKAAAYEVRIECGMADVRKNRGSVFHHFETLIALAEILEDAYVPGTYLAVCENGKTGAPFKVEYGAKLTDVLAKGGAADLEGLRAVAFGSRMIGAAEVPETVIEAETPVGNGVITLYPKTCCMVHESNENLKAYRKASCGKCTFCREGLIQMATHTREITEGQGQKDAAAMLQEIGEAMTFSTQCTLGENAAVFTLEALRLFGDEFQEHIKKKKCANNVCQAFSSIYIDPNECQGCEECADVCPAEAIEGKKGFIHMIDAYECTKCGKCIEVCEYEAIIQTTGRVPKLPNRLIKVGKFKKH